MHEFGHMAKHVINIDVRHVKDEDDCFKLLAAMHKKDIGRAIRVVLDLLPFKASKIINRIVSVSFSYIIFIFVQSFVYLLKQKVGTI